MLNGNNVADPEDVNEPRIDPSLNSPGTTDRHTVADPSADSPILDNAKETVVEWQLDNQQAMDENDETDAGLEDPTADGTCEPVLNVLANPGKTDENVTSMMDENDVTDTGLENLPSEVMNETTILGGATNESGISHLLSQEPTPELGDEPVVSATLEDSERMHEGKMTDAAPEMMDENDVADSGFESQQPGVVNELGVDASLDSTGAIAERPWSIRQWTIQLLIWQMKLSWMRSWKTNGQWMKMM
jgi:hypothetical protein